MRRAPYSWILLVSCASTLAACGAGGLAEPLRPKQTRSADAIVDGPACRAENYGHPLVVDWRPGLRADLEVAMRDGVAIVQYDCHTLRLLPDCSLEGAYRYLGVSRKEHVIQLASADEVRTNLPLLGSEIALRLGADLDRGTTLDIALVMIGLHATRRLAAGHEELRGECGGATHFVRRAFVGAFAMQTGSRGRARAAAQLFGAGASEESVSTRQVRSADGEMAACANASVASESPPSGCSALLRIELAAIGTAAPQERERVHVCPAGLRYRDGKCAPPAQQEAHECKYDDFADCQTQCTAGNVRSCVHLGNLHSTGRFGKAPVDVARALALFRDACEKDDPYGCTMLAEMLAQGSGVPVDLATAIAHYEKACDRGVALACAKLAAQCEAKGDRQRALTLFDRACHLGSPLACEEQRRLFAAQKAPTPDAGP
jgi:TPR repeat protein